MTHLSIFITIFAFLALDAVAKASVCYSSKTAYSSKAPAGWIADYDSGKRIGTCVVYYPSGFKFDTAPAIIYPNLVEYRKLGPSGQLDLDSFINDDIENFKKTSKSLDVKVLAAHTTPSGLNFSIRDFKNAAPPNEFELVAYLTGEKSILVVAYSCRKQIEFIKYRGAWTEFLNNIRSVPRDLIYPEQKKNAEGDAKSASGKGFEDVYFTKISQKLSDAIKTCSKIENKGLKAVFQILKNGSTDEITFERDDEFSLCFKENLSGVQGPPPPFAPFHAFLDVKIKP